MITRKHQELIWAYVTGKLKRDEIDQVWVEILKNPKLLDYLKVVVGLHFYINKKHMSDRMVEK